MKRNQESFFIDTKKMLFCACLVVLLVLVRRIDCRAPGHPLVVQYQDMRNPHPFSSKMLVSSISPQTIVTKRLRIIAVEEPAMFTLTFLPPATTNDKKLNPSSINNYNRNGGDDAAEGTRGNRPEMATGHHFRQYNSFAAQQNATFKSASVDTAAAVTVQSDEPLTAVTQNHRNVDEESFFTVAPTNYYYYDSVDANNDNNKQQRNARRHHHRVHPTLPASFDWLQDDEPPPSSAETKKLTFGGKMVYDYKQHRRYRRRVMHQKSHPKVYRQSDDISTPYWNKVDNDENDDDDDDEDDDFLSIAPPRGLESFYSRYVIKDDHHARGEQNRRKLNARDEQLVGPTQHDFVPSRTTTRMMNTMSDSTNPQYSKRSGNNNSNARYRHAAVHIPKTLASNSQNGMATVFSGQTSTNIVVRRTTTTTVTPSTTTQRVFRPPTPPPRPNFDAPISTFTLNDLPLSECCSGFSAQLLQLILTRVDEQQKTLTNTKVVSTVRLLQARLDDDDENGALLTGDRAKTVTTDAPDKNAVQADYLTVQPTTPPSTFFHPSSFSHSEQTNQFRSANKTATFIVKPGYNVHADGQFHLQWANWLRRQQRQVLHALSQSSAADTTSDSDKSHQNTTFMPHISGNLFTRREIRPWKDQIALLEPIVQSHLLTILPVQLVRRLEQLLLTGDGLDDLIDNNEKQTKIETNRQQQFNWLRNAQRKFATMSSACDLVTLQELLEVRARKAYNIQSPSNGQTRSRTSESERRQARQNALNEQRPVTILPNNRLNTYLLDINFVLVKHPLWPKLKKVESLRKVANHIRKQSVHNTFTLSTLDGVKRILTAPQPRLVPATTHDPLPREQYLVLLGDSLSVQPFIAAHRNSLVVVRELGETTRIRAAGSSSSDAAVTDTNFYRRPTSDSTGIELQDYSFVISKGYSQLRAILDGAIKSLTNGSFLVTAGGVHSDAQFFSRGAAVQPMARQLFDLQQQWLFPLSVEFFNLSRVQGTMRSSNSNGNGGFTTTRFDAQNGARARSTTNGEPSFASSGRGQNTEDEAFASDTDAATSRSSQVSMVLVCCFLSTSFTYIFSFSSSFYLLCSSFVFCTRGRRRTSVVL